jgi:hypothetical protein
MKKLYFSNYQLRELAMFASGEAQARWASKPAELLDLADRLLALAAVAPIAGKISVTGEYNADEADGYTTSWASVKDLCLAAAAKAEKEAEERQRSCFSLFRDLVDPQTSSHRTVTFTAEERD